MTVIRKQTSSRPISIIHHVPRKITEKILTFQFLSRICWFSTGERTLNALIKEMNAYLMNIIFCRMGTSVSGKICVKSDGGFWFQFSSAQFSSVSQSCPTLCDPMNRSTTGLPVHHQLLQFTQTHVHRVSDAIRPSHLLSSPSPPTPSPSQHQGLFQWVSSLHEVDKVLEFQLQHQSFQWTPRTYLL